MGQTTGIAWTDRIWSPWHGCAKISDGCTNCYAADGAKRNPAVLGVWGPKGTRVVSKSWDKPVRWDREAARQGTRFRVFPSICDPFEDRPDLIEPRVQFADLIARTRNLDWLVLTKRIEHAADMLDEAFMHCGRGRPIRDGFGLPCNLWLGVPAEDQANADRRIPILLNIPAAVRFVIVEPLLSGIRLPFFEPINPAEQAAIRAHIDMIGGIPDNSLNAQIGRYYRAAESGLHWVIVGAESGPKRRPMELAWLRSIVEQCQAAGVSCYVKQASALRDGQQGDIPDDLWAVKESPAPAVA